ncbi:tetratricopeptide repeat protein [Phytopseudomonas argentinensis]|uniref:Tetratricopeptide repeat-containing protein n=1 Tax=Phytopseudomonas argentinensis TaxID=289370 RepID=A0A1I3Q2U7_9GAMM|nr:Tetratricopeptide repeat-containing protein [Pseudomonas argentinensis]
MPSIFSRHTLLLASFVLLGACGSNAPSNASAPAGDDAYQRLMKLAGDVEARGDRGTAATLYQRAVEQPGAGFEAWQRLGRARLDSGNARGAEQAYQKAVALEPDNPAALLGLGTAQLRLGYPERAQPLLASAAEGLPGDAQAFARLGAAEAQLGNIAAMQRAFATARQLAPGDLDARSNLALAYALNGDSANALREIQGIDRAPTAQRRHQRNALLVQVLAGAQGKPASVQLDDTSTAQRQALIAEAQRIAAIHDPAERARALGLSAGQ